MAGPLNALSAARYMCDLSGWTLSNLQLQKILYLAQMVYMGENGGEKLIAGNFEAWDYGPVLPDVYREVKGFGKGPIKYIFAPTVTPDAKRAAMLKSACDQLSKVSAGHLVNATHQDIGAWAKYYQPNMRRIVIPDHAILQEYRDRVAQSN